MDIVTYALLKKYKETLDSKYQADIDRLEQEKVSTDQKGTANGVASLDDKGKVPASQLPDYVDDVLEFNSKTDFPANGESGKIYVALDTNKTYRWSGGEYTEISAPLAIGETSSTAGRGDWTKTAHDHTFLTNNPHSVTKTQVGLGKVDNTSDLDKPISTAQQTALDNKVDKVEGKGLSTNDLTNTLKSNYNTAYSWGNHAVEGYLKAITKAMVEGVLTGTITSHNHSGVYEPANSNIQSHIGSTSNPHDVSKSQVGLGNVDNTSDGTKYVQGLRETRANVNTKIWTGTQAQYDAIVTKDATTLYFITE